MWIYKGKSYSDEQMVDLILNIRSGILCLVGPSGCGKTRLIKMVQASAEKQVNILSWLDAEQLAEFSVRWPDSFALEVTMCADKDITVIDSFDLICSYRRQTALYRCLLDALKKLAQHRTVILLMSSDSDTVLPFLRYDLREERCIILYYEV